MRVYNYCNFYFLNSIPTINRLPCDKSSVEIAFVGYSNSGKSSVINTLTNFKKLTKVSSMPGNTKYINLFEMISKIRFVDFPGYGYSKNLGHRGIYWYNIICQYVKKRRNLKGLVLIMDIRHVIKHLDYALLECALKLDVPMLVLLNKSDKLSKNKQQVQLKLVSDKINSISVIAQFLQIKFFSSTKKHGVDSVRNIINLWLF